VFSLKNSPLNIFDCVINDQMLATLLHIKLYKTPQGHNGTRIDKNKLRMFGTINSIGVRDFATNF
jgi:hypothetical protein